MKSLFSLKYFFLIICGQPILNLKKCLKIAVAALLFPVFKICTVSKKKSFKITTVYIILTFDLASRVEFETKLLPRYRTVIHKY